MDSGNTDELLQFLLKKKKYQQIQVNHIMTNLKLEDHFFLQKNSVILGFEEDKNLLWVFAIPSTVHSG